MQGCSGTMVREGDAGGAEVRREDVDDRYVGSVWG